MEELDLKEILNYFWSKKMYIIIASLIALLLGMVYTIWIQEPQYKSYTTILLKGTESQITSNDIALNQKLVDAYREIVKSKRVLNKVITNLELTYSYEQLFSKVTVESVNDTEIIKVSVTDGDNITARDITNEIAYVFNNEVVKLYDLQNIGIIDKAEISDAPSNINVIKQLVLALLIGIVLGFAVVFVMFYFDNTLKNTAFIEEKLGLSIVGSIPRDGGNGNE